MYSKLLKDSAMIEIGAFDAKTHLSALLDQVANGEEVLITRRGKPVARLVPVEEHRQEEIEGAIRAIQATRAQIALGNFSWKQLRDEGRR